MTSLFRRAAHFGLLALLSLHPMERVCGQDMVILSFQSSGRLDFTETTNAIAYRIDWRTNLNSGLWMTSSPPGVAGLIATGSGTRSTTVGVSNGSAYFRIVASFPTGTSLPPDMISISGGTFIMGHATNLPIGEASSDELPVRELSIRGIMVDRHEVTKARWDSVAGQAGLLGYDITSTDAFGKSADHPACLVTWYEAVKWCNARSELEGLAPCYLSTGIIYRVGIDPTVTCNWSANGYRLPTEAEWERAARGGHTGQRFPWSDSATIDHGRANYFSYWLNGAVQHAYDMASTSGFHPAFASGGYPFTSPVGSFAANDFGLFDVAGNVWEWCWDWYSPSYADVAATNDPTGPAFGSLRVLRGGSWGIYANYARVSERDSDHPGNQGFYDAGFRCVRNL
ncbi:MAG TPA: SUMF1/EgtB/PvdO family nonheme iron enzyme [Kiritimatiellia bacterium]|nr:SUMF1/EgtB/PvdO family nonheme iron enzyme [Kiritimatiellia bacterium]HMP33599.1 SUMF1/EgtB/PvdO family nonheme iron enzyme [Kiritimatiellia bacterium]